MIIPTDEVGRIFLGWRETTRLVDVQLTNARHYKMGPPVDSGLSCLRKVAKNGRYNELVFMGDIYHL